MGTQSHHFHQSTILDTVPRVNDIKPALRKISNIPRREHGPPCFGDGGNLGIRVTDKPAECAATGRDPGEVARGLAVESKYPTRKIFREHRFSRSKQLVAAFAFLEDLNPIKDLCFSD